MTRRGLAIAMAALVAWAGLVYVTGGGTSRALGLKISFRSPFRPVLVSAMLFGIYLVTFGWRSLIAELEWLLGALRTAVRSRYGGPFLVVLVFVGIVASYSDFIPYWDAEVYFNCIAEAVEQPFNLLNFRCVGHPSIAYLFFLGLTQYLVSWNVSLMYAANALLGGASIVAFHALLRLLFPKRSPAEYALVTSLYAFAPLFLTHAIFLNLDYGLTAFFALFLYFLLARRFWIASLFAVAMMFTKETGGAAYAVAVLAYVVAFTIRTPMSWKERRAELRSQMPLLAAPFALLTYLVSFQFFHWGPGHWIASYAPVSVIRDPVDSILNTNLADAGIRTYLADMFILNYQWVYTGVLGAALGGAVVRTAESGQERVSLPGSPLFLFLLLLGLTYSVTRYRDYNNARYVLIVSPVLIVAFYHGLLSLFASATSRMCVLSLSAALVFLSNFRTLDFVSKSIFGTFDFGSHVLLDMPSLIGGLRLDSIVYNLESLQFHYLLSDVMQDLRPAPDTVFFMGDTTYNFPPHVDRRSYTLTVDPSRALPLFIFWSDAHLERDALQQHLKSDRFFYLALANADNHQLQVLRRRYALVATKQYERNGYTLGVYTFRFTSMPGEAAPGR